VVVYLNTEMRIYGRVIKLLIILKTMEDLKPSELSFSPLLRLAAELRNRIYFDVLVAEDVIELRRDVDDNDDDRCWTSPGLLRTCRQIRMEARQIYYANNVFTIPYKSYRSCREYGREVVHWLETLGQQQRSMLTRFNLNDRIYYSLFHADCRINFWYHDLNHIGASVRAGTLWVEVGRAEHRWYTDLSTSKSIKALVTP